MRETTAAVFEQLVERTRRGEPCSLVILVRSEGSAPAKPGARMLVAEDGATFGTVGGGAMEARAAEAARKALGHGTPGTLDIELTEDSGYVCGGRVTLYIEPVLPAPRLVIAGGGHVGRDLCTLAAFAGFSPVVADDRDQFADPGDFPDADQVMVVDFATMFDTVPVDENTWIVSATRGHEHDYTVVRAALATPAGYIGLLGSRRKRAAFFEKLEAEGFSDDDIRRIHTPVGLDIGAVGPREIAVSIVAEMISTRRNHGAQGGRDSAGGRSVAANGPDKAGSSCQG
ncbi:MAG: XdhC family protein [Desulfatibacillaceae bacterium]